MIEVDLFRLVCKERWMKIKNREFYQHSTFSALMAGVMYGSVNFDELLKHGNFGLGTFDACDGELIVLNGEAYQVLSSGKVNRVTGTMLSPYASLTNFVTDKKLSFTNISFSELKNELPKRFPSLNIFYAIKVNGVFNTVNLRTLARQKQPFPLLKNAAQDQENFILKNISGNLVMFWTPKFANTVCVDGFHGHFINHERSTGGHVFDFYAKSLDIEICYLTNMNLHLPPISSYLKYELNDQNLQADIKSIE